MALLWLSLLRRWLRFLFFLVWLLFVVVTLLIASCFFICENMCLSVCQLFLFCVLFACLLFDVVSFLFFCLLLCWLRLFVWLCLIVWLIVLFDPLEHESIDHSHGFCARNMFKKNVRETCSRNVSKTKTCVQATCPRNVLQRCVQETCSKNMFKKHVSRNVPKKLVQKMHPKHIFENARETCQKKWSRNVHKKCVQETCSRNTCALHKLRFVSNTGCRTRRFSKMCPLNGFQRCLHKKCVRAMDKSVHATTDYLMLLSSLGGIHSTCFALGLVAAMRFCFMCLLNVS